MPDFTTRNFFRFILILAFLTLAAIHTIYAFIPMVCLMLDVIIGEIIKRKQRMNDRAEVARLEMIERELNDQRMMENLRAQDRDMRNQASNIQWQQLMNANQQNSLAANQYNQMSAMQLGPSFVTQEQFNSMFGPNYLGSTYRDNPPISEMSDSRMKIEQAFPEESKPIPKPKLIFDKDI